MIVNDMLLSERPAPPRPTTAITSAMADEYSVPSIERLGLSPAAPAVPVPPPAVFPLVSEEAAWRRYCVRVWRSS